MSIIVGISVYKTVAVFSLKLPANGFSFSQTQKQCTGSTERMSDGGNKCDSERARKSGDRKEARRGDEGKTSARDVQRNGERLSEWQKEKRSEGAARPPLFIFGLVIAGMINDRYQEFS